MTITGMDHFQTLCREKLVTWYKERIPYARVGFADTFIVWSCKTLQNYKCLVSTNVSGDGIYAEYTFNGDKGELYEDVYHKQTNSCYTK